MRTLLALTAAALVGAAQIPAADEAPAPQPVAPALSLTPAQAVPAEEVFRAYGYYIGKQMGVKELAFSESEIRAFAEGMQLVRQGSEAPMPMERLKALLEGLMGLREKAYAEAQGAKGRAEQAEYFAKLQESNPKVVRTGSGLCYEILEPGKDPKPTAKSTIRAHYRGTFLDGKVFDESAKHGPEPATFRLDQVVRGWTEGLQLIGIGGKIRLHIPSDLAYGDNPPPGIPPAAALIFEVELVEIVPEAVPAPAPAAEPAPAAQ